MNLHFLDYSDSSDDYFYMHEPFFTSDTNIISKSPNENKYPPLNLIENSNDLSILKYLPLNFTLKTNNTSCKFNLDILMHTSPIISELVQNNQNIFHYYLNVSDSKHVLKKYELMYQGEKVQFDQQDQQISKKIASLLNFADFPKGETIVNPERCSIFMRNKGFQNFTITTKNHQYKVNSYGIYFSEVIKDIVIKNPLINHFEYDFDDEFGQFQTVCSLLNFETIEPTKDSIYFLKEIAEDLKISKILTKINDMINNFENDSKIIDSQQKNVDSIEELFHWLYNIKTLTIETVKNLIVDSFWSKKEDDVRELIAFIVCVIKTNFSLHSDISDLLILLQKEANESNSLNILIPSIVSYLSPIFGIQINYCSFVYNLYKKGIISKENLIKEIKPQFKKTEKKCNLITWFLPELIESKIIDKDFMSNLNEKVIYNSDSSDQSKISFGIPIYEEEEEEYIDKKNSNPFVSFILFYYPNKMDQYKLMRDKGEPDLNITKSLINDDVDTLQIIITNSKLDFTKSTVPFNIFDKYKKGKFKEYSYINYAAMFGSIKCFKYLLLNHAEIDKLTFSCAIKGGNIEIIKIIDEKSKKLFPNYLFKGIKLTIKNHQNDLFDWIFQNKYMHELNNGNPIYSKKIDFKSSLLLKSVKYGNAHSFIEIINTGFDFKDYYKSIFEQSAKHGFYRFFSLIMHFNDNKINNQLIINDKKFPFISFGNLSIFKLSLEFTSTKIYIEKTFSFAVKKNYKRIIDYFFSNLINKVFEMSAEGAFTSLKYSIQNQSNELTNLLLDRFLTHNPSIFIGFGKSNILLKKACQNKNVDLVKKFTEIILINNPNENFSIIFIMAASVGSIEICKYFIDKKVFIDQNSLKQLEFDSMSVELFELINNSFPEVQIQFIDHFLSSAITSRNKELVDYLLNNGAPIKNGLFLAVSKGFIDIVDIILKYFNKPSFVNKNSIDGTILHVAINNSDVLMVKRILKIPEINPLLYNNERKSALYLAILSKNMEIIEEILDFYGEKISEKRIVNEISKSAIDLISTKKRNVDKNVILVLKRVLQIKGIDPNIYGPKYTFLLFACIIGEIEIVKMLLKMDDIDVNAYSLDELNTPLMTAIIANHIDIALLLIDDKRTDINLNISNDQTALTMAVKNKLPKVIDSLIKNEKFDPDESNLNLAFFESDGQIATQLSSLKLIDVNYYYKEQSALVNAVDTGNYEKIDLIINHPSFDKDKSQFKKAVSILIERSYGKEFEKILNSLKFDINLSIDSKSILSIAVEHKSLEIIKIILQNPNFDSSKSDILNAFLIGLLNIDKQKAEDHIIYEDDDDDEFVINSDVDFQEVQQITEVQDKRIDKFDILNVLIEFDKEHNNLIDMKKLLPNGKSFFTYRKKISNAKEYVMFLIDHGADPNGPDKDGVYPLEYAISTENEDFVRALINSNKIDLNIKTIMKPKTPDFQATEKNETFLHLAAKIKNNKIFRLLLKMELFDINAVDDLGETPLMKACRCGAEKNVSLLFKNENLNYLHRNNEGKDALEILECFYINRKNESQIKDKSKYEEKLLHLINLNENNVEKYSIRNDLLYKSDDDIL